MQTTNLNPNKLKGISWFILSLIISVANDGVMKYLGENISAYEVVFLRFLFGTIVLIPFLFIKGKQYKTSRIFLHVVRGLLLFVGISLWCMGLVAGKLAVATTINFTIPIFVLILAIRFLGESFSMLKTLATLGGFIGILVVVNPTSADFDVQSLLLILSAFLFASLDVINKKFISRETMLSMLLYSNVFAVLFSAVPATLSWVTPDIKSFVLLFLLGIGANLILYCLLKSFSYIEVSSVAPYRYLELIFSITLGYLFFGEIFGVVNLVGASIIIGSTLILSYEALLAKRIKKL